MSPPVLKYIFRVDLAPVGRWRGASYWPERSAIYEYCAEKWEDYCNENHGIQASITKRQGNFLCFFNTPLDVIRAGVTALDDMENLVRNNPTPWLPILPCISLWRVLLHLDLEKYSSASCYELEYDFDIGIPGVIVISDKLFEDLTAAHKNSFHFGTKVDDESGDPATFYYSKKRVPVYQIQDCTPDASDCELDDKKLVHYAGLTNSLTALQEAMVEMAIAFAENPPIFAEMNSEMISQIILDAFWSFFAVLMGLSEDEMDDSSPFAVVYFRCDETDEWKASNLSPENMSVASLIDRIGRGAILHVVNQAWQSKEAVIMQDFKKHPRAIVAWPIFVGDECVGILTFLSQIRVLLPDTEKIYLVCGLYSAPFVKFLAFAEAIRLYKDQSEPDPSI